MDKFPSVDELIKMAKEDPEKLNALQKSESQKIIDRASPENKVKLEGIQFKIDMIKRKNKGNQTKTMIELNGIMKESFNKLSEELKVFQGLEQNNKKPHLKIIKKEDN